MKRKIVAVFQMPQHRLIETIFLFTDNISPVCLPLTPQLKRTKFSEYLVTSWGGYPLGPKNKSPTFDNLKMQKLHSTDSSECHPSENIIFFLFGRI